MNPTSGGLTALPGSPFTTGSASPVVIHPNNKFAYYASSGKVIGVAINSSTGALTALSNSQNTVASGAHRLVIDPAGRFMYVLYGSANIIHAFSINGMTGALTPIPGSPFSMTGSGSAFYGAIDPSSKYLYLASNISGNIAAFTINSTTGALTTLPGSPFSAGSNLAWIGIHPTGAFLYVNDFGFGAGATFGYTIDATTGALTRIPGLLAQGGAPHGGIIDPKGKFLYVAGEYTRGILGFTINPTTGTLTTVAGSPFPSGSFPNVLATDPAGKVLLAPNNFTHNISTYSINLTTGALTAAPGSPFLAGTSPGGVAVATGSSDVPVIITPTHGGNTGKVTVQITGNGYQPGATAKLTGLGADIIGNNTTVPNASVLTTTFNLIGTTPGLRTLVVTNPDSTFTSVPSSFMVNPGGSAEISVRIIGRDKIRFGTPQTYYFGLVNTGSIDSPPGIVSLNMPSVINSEPKNGEDLFVAGVGPSPPFGIPGVNAFVGLNVAASVSDRATMFTTSGVPAGGTQTAPLDLTLPFDVAGSDVTVRGSWQPDQFLLTFDDHLAALNPPAPKEPFQPQCSQCFSQTIVQERAWQAAGDAYLAYNHARQRVSLAQETLFLKLGIAIAKATVIVPLGTALGLSGAAKALLNTFITTSISCGTAYFGGTDCLPSVRNSILLAHAGVLREQTPLNSSSLAPLFQSFNDMLSALDAFGNLQDLAGAQHLALGTFQQSLGQYLTARNDYRSCLNQNCGGSVPPPPAIDWPGTTSLRISGVGSLDPNDKVGPAGTGPQHHVSGTRLQYLIEFENKASATAPAQAVSILDTVNPAALDLSSLVLGPISFVNKSITPPSVPLSVLGTYSTDVDLRPSNNLIVRITVSLNTTTGLLKWVFTSLDAVTGQPTTDPLAGFLPPAKGGGVFFSAMPKPLLTTGAVIQNKAAIVFDVNPPIDTPVWINTIDLTRPISLINSLPAQSPAAFSVSWTGSDVGSGIQNFTVYVSDNGSAFSPWLSQTTSTKAVYSGLTGHTYSFYSVAKDMTGNVETAKTIAEATTRVSIDTTPPVITPQIVGTLGNNDWYRSNVTVSWTVGDPESGIVTSSGCTAATLNSDTVSVTLTCSATNGAGLTTSVSIKIKVDKTPPVISGMPAVGCALWPPDHKMVSVATVTSRDALSGMEAFNVTGTSSEPPDPGETDIIITGSGLQPRSVQLRADRSAMGDGRTYKLAATAVDLAGNSATASASCIVPHDQNR